MERENSVVEGSLAIAAGLEFANHACQVTLNVVEEIFVCLIVAEYRDSLHLGLEILDRLELERIDIKRICGGLVQEVEQTGAPCPAYVGSPRLSRKARAPFGCRDASRTRQSPRQRHPTI